MLFTFIGAIACAILAACVAFVVRRTTGVNARWLIPAAAGSAMLGFTIWNDYDWFSRNVAGLPPDVVVTQTFEVSHVLQPWTLLFPATTRYQAVDLDRRQPHTDRPEIVRAVVYLVARWQPTFETIQVFDCAAGKRADAAAPTGPDGLPAAEAWSAVGAGDPLLAAACRGV